jgi:hypothetical protein
MKRSNAAGGDIGFFGDGKVRPDKDTNLDKYTPNNERHYDDATMREAVKNVKSGDYGVCKNNCQDYSDKLRQEYRRLERQNRSVLIG